MTGPSTQARDALGAWADSGAMSLSGPPPYGGLGPPTRLVAGLEALAFRIRTATTEVGHRVEVDGLVLLTERARQRGATAGGRTSCGGATRLLECTDGWVALSLARDSDVELLPAFLAVGADAGVSLGAVLDDPWEVAADAIAGAGGRRLAAAAELVGLPVGVLAERTADAGCGVTRHDLGPATARRRPPRVVDLSSLWAGPLCGSILADMGAEVLKVESTGRPDGARAGDPELYRRLNHAKEPVAVDLGTEAGRRALHDLIATADVVIESSRPRALEQLGLVARDLLRRPTGPDVWVSITGHGRASSRVAFGDDAAVAGGLVVTDADGPWFCVDAIADPLSGLSAAVAALDCLLSGRRALVDVAMAGVAAAFAGPTLPTAAAP